MKYIRVANTEDLPEGKMILVSPAGVDVLLANVEDSYYAIANRCPHMGGSLAKGTLEGGVVTCPRHGAQFDVLTGKNVRSAKIAFIKTDLPDQPVYPVQIEGTDILVGIPG